MSATTDPNDPRLGHGVDTEPRDQHDVYLVLSEEERAKGFVRPVRNKYTHVGLSPVYPLRELTTEEHKRYDQYKYVMYEEYPKSESSSIGRFWTQEQLDTKGCGQSTTMGSALSETYARDPKFYGSTYCSTCRMHKAVEEFVWKGTNERVGS